MRTWTFEDEKSRAGFEKTESCAAGNSGALFPGKVSNQSEPSSVNTGVSMLSGNFLVRTAAVAFVVSGLAACNKQPHQNAADLKAQESRQEFTLRMQEADKAKKLALQATQHAHELEKAEIQADVDRERQKLDAQTQRRNLELAAETDRLANHDNSIVKQNVGIVAVIGGLIAGFMGWRSRLYHTGRTIIETDRERTRQMELFLEYLNSLPADERGAQLERMFESSPMMQSVDFSTSSTTLEM